MVTQTMPSRANRDPSLVLTAPLPLTKAPPWSQTMTGRGAESAAGVQTFKFRQSWPWITGSGSSGASASGYGGFGTVGPYSTASRTPSQDGAGVGAANRCGPNGAAA